MTEAIIEVCDLSFGYPNGPVLFSHLDLMITKASFLGILGPNGSGKSTLLGLLTGRLRPLTGQVLVDGRPVRSYRPAQLAERIALVSQDPVVPAGFTVAQTVMMAQVARSAWSVFLDKAQIDIVRQALCMTDTIDLADRPLDRISGGERQRVYLARAFAQQAELIVLDEPTAFLDLRSQIEAYRLLKLAQNEQARTIVVVTHDLNLALRYCDRVLLLAQGPDKMGQPIIGRPEDVLTGQRVSQVFGVQVECGMVGGAKVFVPASPRI